MQKQLLKVLAAVVVTAFVVTSVAQAQEEGEGRRRNREGRGERQGGGRFGGRGGFGAPGEYMSLLRMEAVQKELKVEDAQEKSIDELATKLRGERGERGGERPNFRDMSAEEREKFITERRKEAEKRSKEAKKGLASILSEEQMKRLNQISIQAQGIRALNDPEVADKLEMTDEQIGALDEAEEKNRDKMRTTMRELRESDDREAAFAKMTELREEAEKNIMAVLTKEQQAKFEEMKGKKFEFPSRGGRGGFGRGRGNREGGDREGGRRERRRRDE